MHGFAEKEAWLRGSIAPAFLARHLERVLGGSIRPPSGGRPRRRRPAGLADEQRGGGGTGRVGERGCRPGARVLAQRRWRRSPTTASRPAALLDAGGEVSIDAWASRKPSPNAIVDAGGDYALTLRTTIRPCAKTSDCGSIPKSPAAGCPFWKRWRRTTAGSKSAATPSATGSMAGAKPAGRAVGRASPPIIGAPAGMPLPVRPERDRFATAVRSHWGNQHLSGRARRGCLPNPEGPLRRNLPCASHGPHLRSHNGRRNGGSIRRRTPRRP